MEPSTLEHGKNQFISSEQAVPENETISMRYRGGIQQKRYNQRVQDTAVQRDPIPKQR